MFAINMIVLLVIIVIFKMLLVKLVYPAFFSIHMRTFQSAWLGILIIMFAKDGSYPKTIKSFKELG